MIDGFVTLSSSQVRVAESVMLSSFQQGELLGLEYHSPGMGKASPERQPKGLPRTVFSRLCSERPEPAPLGSKKIELCEVIVT